MSEADVRVEELLKRMGGAAIPADDAASESAQRIRTVSAVNARLDEVAAAKRRRRRTLRAFVVTAAAAFVVGIAAFASLLPGRAPSGKVAESAPAVRAVTGDVEIVHGGQRSRASSDASSSIAQADEIHTTAGARASAALPSGARLSIDERSLVRLSSLSSGGEELRLSHGRVEIQVPKLRAGTTLAVRTPDARVTVRGTHFVVEVALLGAKSVTTVSVLEGSVWVDTRGREVVLERGARWSSGHEPEPAAEPAHAPAEPPASVAHAPSGGAQSAVTSSAPREPESTLGLENELYLDAMRAVRAGDDARANERLGELLARYPKSPLAPNARAELERVRSRRKASP